MRSMRSPRPVARVAIPTSSVSAAMGRQRQGRKPQDSSFPGLWRGGGGRELVGAGPGVEGLHVVRPLEGTRITRGGVGGTASHLGDGCVVVFVHPLAQLP